MWILHLLCIWSAFIMFMHMLHNWLQRYSECLYKYMTTMCEMLCSTTAKIPQRRWDNDHMHLSWGPRMMTTMIMMFFKLKNRSTEKLEENHKIQGKRSTHIHTALYFLSTFLFSYYVLLFMHVCLMRFNMQKHVCMSLALIQQ